MNRKGAEGAKEGSKAFKAALRFTTEAQRTQRTRSKAFQLNPFTFLCVLCASVTSVKVLNSNAKTPRLHLKASDNCQNKISVITVAVANSKTPTEYIIFLVDVRSGLIEMEQIDTIAMVMVKTMLKQ